MDVTPYLDLRPAPHAVFSRLPERETRPRFMVQARSGQWEAVTWGEYARAVRQAALYLDWVGLKPGERAAIFAPNSVPWITAAMGVQALGGVVVPIYAASTSAQAGYVATHSDARVLFVGTPALLERVLEAWDSYREVVRIVTLSSEPFNPGPILEALKARGVTTPSLSEVEQRLVPWAKVLQLGAGREATLPLRFDQLIGGVTLDQVAQLLYTSGTSGNPKGVPLTHRNVGVNGRDWLTCNAPLLEANDVDLLWLPMSHIFGFGEACLGNSLGWLTYLTEPSQVLAQLPKVRPQVFMSVPAVWEKLAALAAHEVDQSRRTDALHAATGGNLRFCLSGGAGLKREVKELFRAAGLLIIEGYGLTESSPTLTLNRPDAYRFDSVGKVLPSVQVKLAEDGEILAKGESIFSGYHKDPQATEEVFTADGWLKTGDVGRFTDDGFLQIIDRKKDILVTAGGKNVPPANIELRFRDDPFIAAAVVYGDAKKYLVAGLWLNQAAIDAALDRAGVEPQARGTATLALVQQRVDLVNAQLASFETIKKFTVIDAPLTVEGGLLTSTLKLRRKAVYAAFHRQLEALYE
jgi:long-chain acyl-CoA synthetase